MLVLALANILHKITNAVGLGGLSSLCANLEPARSNSNEILEINVLQTFSPHALWFYVNKKFKGPQNKFANVQSFSWFHPAKGFK